MNASFERYQFLRVLSKYTHLDYSSLMITQDPLSSSLGYFDSIHCCHSVVYQTCKDARIPLRAQLCRYLQPAFLKAKALLALQELESSLANDTAIVAYAAPLQIKERAQMGAEALTEASYRTVALVWCVVLMLVAGGCVTAEESLPTPDLIAVPDGSFGGPDAYCDMTSVPQLRIVIQNQAQGPAPSSITRVRFSPGGTVDIPTAPLESAQHTALAPIRIPAACFDPDCDFTITVDAKGQIDETTGEENNVTGGRCIRP